MPVAFDTRAYARRLKGAGFSDQQAEVQAEALAAVVSDVVATKQDLRELEYRLTIRLGAMTTVAVGAMAASMKLL